ncbi:MAG: nucleotide exchange factor GrpE [Candidatus Andersenbacteria bacterium]
MNKRNLKTQTATSQPASAPRMAEPTPAIAKMQAQAEEYLAGWKRAQADYDNLRKRTQEQRGQILLAAVQEVVRGILPVLDTLEQVLKHAGSAKKNAESKELYVGVELVAKQLLEVLASHGVSEIESVGTAFDPALHEAIASVPGPKNIIIAEHARGFKLGEVTLRASRVSVGNGAPTR